MTAGEVSLLLDLRASLRPIQELMGQARSQEIQYQCGQPLDQLGMVKPRPIASPRAKNQRTCLAGLRGAKRAQSQAQKMETTTKQAVLAMSALVERGQPYVIIHDARRAVRPTPKQRAFAAEQQKRDAEATRRLLRGVALVTASPLISGVLTAVNWIFAAPYPQKTFSTLDAAETWATAQLGKDGG